LLFKKSRQSDVITKVIDEIRHDLRGKVMSESTKRQPNVLLHEYLPPFLAPFYEYWLSSEFKNKSLRKKEIT